MKEKKELRIRAWIARDENGELYIFGACPKRQTPKGGLGYWHTDGRGSEWFWRIPEEDDIFGEDVKWEDEDPLEISFCHSIDYEKPEK